jgi:hypothetical protein
MASSISSEKFKPLLFNQATGEHFLRLPVPYDNIVLTPPRWTDVPTIIPLLNDPKVYKSLGSTPYPYLIEHASRFQERVTMAYDKVIEEILSKEEGAFVDGCPVRSLREIQPDGSELFLGDVGVTRHEWQELEDLAKRQALAAANLSRGVGNVETVWEVGGILHCLSRRDEI